MSTNHLNEVVDDYLDNSPDPEQEALNLVVWLQMRYSWATVVFTRQDVETAIDRPITDEEWDKVTATPSWKEMYSILIEGSEGWEPIYMAIEEAGIDDRE